MCYYVAMEILYILDLLGTTSFALVGAYAAIRHKYDIIGIIICGFLTAVGGSTIRSLLLVEQPVYFSDSSYLAVVVVGIALAIVFFRYLPKLQSVVLIIDAIGLATFAYIGAQVAVQHGLSTIMVVIMAAITAVGGGLLRDIAMREKPQIFYKDFYATPALLLGLVYVLFPELQTAPVFIYGIIGMTIIVRLSAIRYAVEVWRPWTTGRLSLN